MNWRESVENQVSREKKESPVVDIMTLDLEESKDLQDHLASQWVLRPYLLIQPKNIWPRSRCDIPEISDFLFHIRVQREIL